MLGGRGRVLGGGVGGRGRGVGGTVWKYRLIIFMIQNSGTKINQGF